MGEGVGACVGSKVTKDGLAVAFAVRAGMLCLHGEVVVADAAAALSAKMYGERFRVVPNNFEQ